jgi:transposase
MLVPTQKRPWFSDHDDAIPPDDLTTLRRDSASWRHVAYTFLADPQADMARRSDVTEAQWQQIAPYLYAAKRKGGRPLKDQRAVLNGVLYVLTNGCPWRHMLPCYGHYVTCWRRLLRWQNMGVWPHIQRILAATNHPIEHISA